jgi:hypothetical protein
MDAPNRFLRIIAFLKNPAQLLALGPGSGTSILEVLVREENGNVMRVEESDDFVIRERTRSQRKGTPSASTRPHSAIVGEEKDRPPALFRESFGLEERRGPPDFIQPAFILCRFERGHPLGYPGGVPGRSLGG